MLADIAERLEQAAAEKKEQLGNGKQHDRLDLFAAGAFSDAIRDLIDQSTKQPDLAGRDETLQDREGGQTDGQRFAGLPDKAEDLIDGIPGTTKSGADPAETIGFGCERRRGCLPRTSETCVQTAAFCAVGIDGNARSR